jgi:lysophospholipase L1-like esterase
MNSILPPSHPDLEWHEKSPDWAGRFKKIMLIDFVIGLALVILIELALRIFVPATTDLIFTRTITAGHPIIRNEFELRDDPFLRQKPLGERRILALGNSATFGAGVGDQETWPQQLERNLGDGVQVINGGGQGGSMDAILAFLEKDGLSFQPDLVVLAFSPSMIAKTGGGGDKKQAQGMLGYVQKIKLEGLERLQNSYTYVTFDFYVRKNLYRFRIIQDDLTRPNGAAYAYGFDTQKIKLEPIENDYERFFIQLQKLQAVLEKKSIPLVLIGIPSQFEIDNRPDANPRRYPLDKIRIQPLNVVSGYAEKLTIPYIDFRPVFKGRNDLYIATDFTHLNANGLGLIALNLSDYLKNLKETRP